MLALNDTSVIIMGGYNGNEYQNNVLRYDLLTNSYKVLNSMQQARSSAGAILYKDKVYIFGGHFNLEYLDNIESYDP